MERVAFKVNYSVAPPTLDVMSLDDLTTARDDDPYGIALLSLVDDSLRSGKKLMSLLYIVYRRGDVTMSLSIAKELSLTEKFGAKLQPGAKEGPKRAGGQDLEENPVKTSYDEIDEMIRRRLRDVSADRHPWDRRYELKENLPDWPFVHGTMKLLGREFAPLTT